MDQAIVLGRIGHYFDAGNGSCSTALVVDVQTTYDSGAQEDGQFTLAVAGWHHDGMSFERTSVDVVSAPTTDDHANSFHLTRDCPWNR